MNAMGMSSPIYQDYLGNVHVKPTGVAPTWRISAYALVQREGKYLLIKQRGRKDWELPGGGVELTESVCDGAVREAYEETGYRVRVAAQPFYVFERGFFGRREQKFFKNIMLVYRGELQSGKQDRHVINTVVEDEISETAWVSLLEINEENCHPMFWPMIEKLQQH